MAQLSFSKPLIMGVLNVTPDSFSDGGKFVNPDLALTHALQMIEEGADIIDIGGESSGPGSKDVSLDEELFRILPVLEKLRQESNILISIDTYKAKVAQTSLEKGANIINDVTALRGDPTMAETLASYQAPVIIMYSKDPNARTTRQETHYENVVQTIHEFLEERLHYAEQKGLKRSRFILDPGMGAFISTDPKYSLQTLKNLEKFQDFKLPILVGASRKGFIGQILDLPVGHMDQRLEGGLACAAVAVWNGAKIIRTHDVKATKQIVDMVWAIKNA